MLSNCGINYEKCYQSCSSVSAFMPRLNSMDLMFCFSAVSRLYLCISQGSFKCFFSLSVQSTQLCFLLFSPLGKLAGRATRFPCVNFFFFLVFNRSRIISGSARLIFTIFSQHMIDSCVKMTDSDLFFRFSKRRCHGNQCYGKMWVYAFSPPCDVPNRIAILALCFEKY